MRDTKCDAIIEALCAEYFAVYVVEWETGNMSLFRTENKNEQAAVEYADTFTLEQAMLHYVDQVVHPEDRPELLRFTQMNNLRSKLDRYGSYEKEFRRVLEHGFDYAQMRFMKIQVGEEKKIVVAIRSINKLMEHDNTMLRNKNVAQALSDDYESVFYVDVQTQFVSIYRVSDSLKEAYENIYENGVYFSDAMQVYIINNVVEEDKEHLESFATIEGLLLQLEDEVSCSTNYRATWKGEERYYRMKAVKVSRKDQVVGIVVGIADANEQIRKDVEYKNNLEAIEQIRMHQRSILHSMMVETYRNAYKINFDTDQCNRLRILDNEFVEENVEGGFLAVRKRILSKVCEEDYSRIEKALGIFLEGMQPGDSRNFLYRSNDEERRWYSIRIRIMQEAGCRVATIFQRDDTITARAQEKERELELENARNLSIVNSLCRGFRTIAYVDCEEGTSRFVRIHPYIRVRYHEIISQPNIDFVTILRAYIEGSVHKEDRRAIHRFLDMDYTRHLLRDREEIEVHFRMYRGSRIEYMRLCMAPALRDNEIVGVVFGFESVDKEVRRQKEYENRLKTALSRAEQANKSKSTFLFNMSHDIRTPMNAILGYTEMAKRHVNDPKKVFDCLDKVETSGEHLLKLINDILDMARIESGKMTIDAVPVDSREVFRDLQMMLQNEMEAKNLMFVTDFNITEPYVYLDVLRLNQAMLNLLSNAMKFTKPGGRIEFSVTQRPAKREGVVTFEVHVKDTGIGMSEEFRRHAFEEFERERNTTSSKVLGTGLGLAITKRLVDLCHGTISVDSKLGEGSDFTVIFDSKIAKEYFAEELREGEQEELNRGFDFKGKKLLLVEDNELNREIALEILQEEGFLVEAVEDGCIAVERVTQSPAGTYDLVLMDIQMPYMDGYAATEAIRDYADEAIRSIPIVAMTANAFDEDRERAFAVGMNDHIAKPIDIAKLLTVLDKLLGA